MFYEKDESQTKDLYYTVEQVLDGIVKESVQHKLTVWIGESDEVIINIQHITPKTFNGYRYVGISQSFADTQKVASGTVIQLYYEKDSFEYSVEYYYDGVKDESATEKGSALYGTVIDSYIAKHKDGFCLDLVENMPLTITHEADKNVIRVYYATDLVGHGDNPDNIPDKYQKKVIFKVVYGTWADLTANDIVIYVTLTKDGKWDINGVADIEAPDGMIASEGYELGSWDKVPPKTVSGTQTETFTYTFDKKVDIPLTSDTAKTGVFATMAIVALAGVMFGRKKSKREEI